MNIFYIPSWYPNERSPISGIFFKEQALAIGEICNECNVIICIIGQGEYSLSFRNIKSITANYRGYLKEKPYIKKISKNVWECYMPQLEWSHRFLRGDVRDMVKKSSYIFKIFLEKLGRIDIIHAHVSHPAGYVAMELSKKYGVPYIITEHMGNFPYPRFLKYGRLTKRIERPLKNANALIAVSNYLAKRMNSYGLNKALVIPNLVNEDFFILEDKINRNNKYTFFTLSAIAPWKGIDDLLNAIAIVVESHKNVIFRIAGDGDFKEYYKEMSEKLNIDKYIIYRARLDREQVRKEFNNCDCFILPSYQETFGVVYAEAIACGKPIIASKCGGPEDIVSETNGKMVEIGNIDDIASNIIYMIENIDKYDSKKIRKEFKLKFSKRVVVKQIYNVYEKTVEANIKGII